MLVYWLQHEPDWLEFHLWKLFYCFKMYNICVLCFVVCPLQSLARGHLLKCSTTAGSSQFYHTCTLQPLLCPPEKMAKQTDLCVTPLLSQSGIILQNAKHFSLSAKQMAAHGHDHTKLWTAEKVLSISLLGIVPTAFLIPSQFMDYLLAISVVMHNHWWVSCFGNEKFYIFLWHDIDRQAHIYGAEPVAGTLKS